MCIRFCATRADHWVSCVSGCYGNLVLGSHVYPGLCSMHESLGRMCIRVQTHIYIIYWGELTHFFFFNKSFPFFLHVTTAGLCKHLFFVVDLFFLCFSLNSNIDSNSIIGSCVYPGLCNTHKSLGRMCIWMLSTSGIWLACVSGFVQHARTIGSHVHPGSSTHLQHLLGGANAFFFSRNQSFRI